MVVSFSQYFLSMSFILPSRLFKLLLIPFMSLDNFAISLKTLSIFASNSSVAAKKLYKSTRLQFLLKNDCSAFFWLSADKHPFSRTAKQGIVALQLLGKKKEKGDICGDHNCQQVA